MDEDGSSVSNHWLRDLYPTRAEVDLGRIRSNLAAMRRRAHGARIMAVVKADAYGHGAVPVAGSLERSGVEQLAVAQLQEAVELRRAGLSRPILVMGVPGRDDLSAYTDHDIGILVATPEWARAVADHAGDDRRISVHVKVDTGMHRLGMPAEDVEGTLEILQASSGVRLAGLWTHMASADEPDNPYTREQHRALIPIVERYGDRFESIHVAASHAVHFFPEVLADRDKGLVRLGISLYGYLQDADAAAGIGLSPAMRVVSRVAQTRVIDAGESVSYNRRWTATRRSHIATVSCGYADGYFRALSNRSEVGIDGQRYPVVGTVCMDLVMVDLGPPGVADVREGDEVVMFGEGGPSAYDLADWAGTIVYEVCTNVSRRVLRVYSDDRPVPAGT